MYFNEKNRSGVSILGDGRNISKIKVEKKSNISGIHPMTSRVSHGRPNRRSFASIGGSQNQGDDFSYNPDNE